MEVIFNMGELDNKQNFVQRGAYLHEGTIGLFFGLIAGEQLPPYLKTLASKLKDQNISQQELPDGSKLWYFPAHEEICKTISDSYYNRDGTHPKPPKAQVHKQQRSTSEPQKIDAKKAAELLLGKKVLMFSGAGISKSSGVPDMMQLQMLIDEVFNPALAYITEIIENKADDRLAKAKQLYQLFMHSEPSTAHLRIADLYQYGFGLVSGNIDGLHEKTGVSPIRYTSKNDAVDGLGEFDILLTIGLGDEGNNRLTERFRNANPHGKVMAVNKERPDYLAPNDYLILGDSDEILEVICHDVIGNNETSNISKGAIDA